MEKQLNETQVGEAKLKEQSRQHKKKLLEDLAEEGTKKDEEMKKLQQMKEEERKVLFNQMHQVEGMTDVLIKELTASNSRYSDPKKVYFNIALKLHYLASFFCLFSYESKLMPNTLCYSLKDLN